MWSGEVPLTPAFSPDASLMQCLGFDLKREQEQGHCSGVEKPFSIWYLILCSSLIRTPDPIPDYPDILEMGR